MEPEESRGALSGSCKVVVSQWNSQKCLHHFRSFLFMMVVSILTRMMIIMNISMLMVLVIVMMMMIVVVMTVITNLWYVHLS